MNERDGRPRRALTIKSLVFSALAIAVITGLSSIQWNLVGPHPPMIGNHLPAGVFFYVMIVVLVWNGLVARAIPSAALTTRELAVVMGVSLIAAFPPTSGLFRYFNRQLMLPWYYLSTGGKPDWETVNVLGYLPDVMFPNPRPELIDGVLETDQTIYNGFFTGLKQGNTTLGLLEVPWSNWVRPLLFWGPVVFLGSVALIALSLVVHQQWVKHEQLSYPVAQVAHAFVHRAKGVGVPDVFRNKLFWWGFTPIFVLYGIDYLHDWFPAYIPSMDVILPNLKHWWVNMSRDMPVIRKAPGWWRLQGSSLYFCVVGLAYFVSSEISFTLGFSHILFVITGVWVFKMRGTPITGTELSFFRAGGYLCYAMILIYTGRAFYWAVARKAMFFGKPSEHESGSVMAARVFVLATAGFAALLIAAGMDWAMALFFTLLLTLLFLVLTRLVCECGIPFVQPGWHPGNLMTSMIGPAAVGPGPLVWANYVGSVLAQDPRECLMPYASTAMRVAEDSKVKPKRLFWGLIVALVVAVVVGFVTTHWTLYNYGGMATDGYASRWPPQAPFNQSTKKIMELQDLGVMDESADARGLGKLALMAPIGEDMWPFVLGIAAVLMCSVARFRFTRFPIHPAIFLIVCTYAGYMTWYSFFVGWAVKALVVRFGGGKVYQRLKPLFIGIITAELAAVGCSISITLIHYWWTGEVPDIHFGILPG